jgi:hypothetical protein
MQDLIDGLSTFNKLELAVGINEFAQVIDTSKFITLRVGEVRPARNAQGDTGLHVAIVHPNPTVMFEWAENYGNDDHLHWLSLELIDARVGEVRRTK